MLDRMEAAVGRTGYGKSSKVRERILAHRRAIILEQKPEKVIDWEGFDVEWYRTPAELNADLAALPPGASFRVGIVPGLAGFVDCLRIAWALGDVLLVIEEAGKYFPYQKSLRKPYHMPVVSGGNMNVPGEFLEICERGRHAGPRGDGTQPVGVLITSQRPKRLPLCFQAELDRVYAFMLRVTHDRRWLAECPGSSEELAEETRNLPKFHYLNIPGEGEVTRETTKP